MIVGAHSIIYSKNAEADRVFLKDVLQLPFVDIGQGWLIFGLPPSEVAFHAGENNSKHEFYLICEDVNVFVGAMADRGVTCSTVQEERWGRLTNVTLPGGGTIGVYEPRHARPPETKVRAAPRSVGKRKRAARTRAKSSMQRRRRASPRRQK
jgi:hypothetical protein